jgi:4-amino-4-deoxy-L-arabinose transferase-like glycosyltransferase
MKLATQNSKFQIRLVVVAAVAAYFIGLGALPLIGPDEPRYAQVAREMLERNDFLTPTLGGFDWFEKPALLYWLQIVSYKIFGVTEFAARFPSALFGLLTILTVYLLCKFVSNREAKTEIPKPKIDFANYAFLVTASSIGMLVFSHAASFDIILTFPITAALACFFAFEIENRKPKIENRKFLVGFYFFIGVALLAKGLVGIVLPFGIIFWFFAATRRFPSKTFWLSLTWGAIVSAAVAATWYAPMYFKHGYGFVDEFFVQHHFARYTSNKYAHPEPFWFFWAILPALLLPWTPFLLAAIWRIISRKAAKTQSENDRHFHIFLLCWLLVPLAFFTVSGSKLPGYIMPALPAAAILAAEQARRFAERNERRDAAFKILALTVFVAVIVVTSFFGERLTRHDTTKFLLREADARGFSDARVFNLHDISHSLEFYAAGRTVRNAAGRQQKFEGVGEIFSRLKQDGASRALVLVPVQWEHQLTESDLFAAQKIADNGGYSLVAVTVRQN